MKIVVAGAGVMGLSCAWRLACGGASVEVLDPRGPGQRATLAALGALWPASPLARGPLQELHRASLWRFEEYVLQLSGESGVAVRFRRGGRMEILNSVKAAARARQEAEAACREWPAFGGGGPIMEVVDYAAARGINPGVASFSHGALVCRGTAQVRVEQLVEALVKACRGRGVAFEAASVTGLLREGGRVTGVESSTGNIFADAVLVTAGAWTARLCVEVAACAAITPAKGQGLALAMPAECPVSTILKSGTIYLIPWEEEILVGSTTEPEAGFDEQPTAEGREKLLAGAAALAPALGKAVVLRHWAGLRPEPPDKLPIMGPVAGAAGLFVCAGHYKTGIGLSPLVSELMARAMVGNAVARELEPFLPGGSPQSWRGAEDARRRRRKFPTKNTKDTKRRFET